MKKQISNFYKYLLLVIYTLDFYTLMFYSFSQQFRFNNKGEFNMPCGNDCFSDKNKEYIRSGRKNNGVNLLTEYNFNETPNNAKNINRTVTSEETAESDLQITRKKGS